MAIPNLTLGPLDPDAGTELTANLGVHNHASSLLKAHAANMPVELTLALARPVDAGRTETLDLDEVEAALRDLKGRDAFFEEDDTLIHGRVLETTKRNVFVVACVFEKPSGRTAKGIIPYEGMKKSERAFEEFEEEQDLPRHERRARRKPESDDVVRAAQEARDEAEARARQAEASQRQMEERLAALENPEPWPDYATAPASEVAAKIAEGGVDEFGRSGLDKIEVFEKTLSKPRRAVLNAIKAALITPRQ